MTVKTTAWLTTSQTMPEAVPGITITAADVDENGYREERGEIQTSEPQPQDWARTDGLGYGEPRAAADALLDAMGWKRIGYWQHAGTSHAADVQRKEE